MKVRIGRNIPSRGWKAGDEVEVSQAEKESFQKRGMLLEQVQAAAGRKKAEVDKVVGDREDATGETLRRINRDLEEKLRIERERTARLQSDLDEARAALRESEAKRESEKAAALRAASAGDSSTASTASAGRPVQK